MRHFFSRLCLLLLLMPGLSLAGWQVAQPLAPVPKNPFLQSTRPPCPVRAPVYVKVKARCQTRVIKSNKPSMYAISVSGSLKENIERIMQRYHWKVKWKAPYDYNFDGRVTGKSLPNVMQKLLSPFPLQAILYMSNRTMLVVPRNL